MFKRIMSLLVSLTMMLCPLTVFGMEEVKPHEAAQAAVISVVPTPSTNVAGNIQSVSVQVSTTNVADGTSITAVLMENDGITPVSGVGIASGTVSSNTAVLTLSIPAVVGAGSYIIKSSIDSLNISNAADYTITPGAQPNISAVSAFPNNHTAGTQQVAAVTISTANVSNTPAVSASVQLVDSNGIAVPGVSAAMGTIVNNSVTVDLTIPSTIAAGSYKLKAVVASVSNTNTAYTINPQSSAPDITQVSLSSLRQNVGESKTIGVTVITQQISDGTAFTLTLVDSQGTPVNNVPTVSGTLGTSNGITSGAAQFTIPVFYSPARYAVQASLTVNSTEKTKTSPTFSIVQPDITVNSVSTSGASLAQGSISGSMTISGTYFSTVLQNNQVVVVNDSTQSRTSAAATSSSNVSIAAAIPVSLTAGTYSVEVTVSGKTATKGAAFVISAPQSGSQGSNNSQSGGTGSNSSSTGNSGSVQITTPSTEADTSDQTQQPDDINGQINAIEKESDPQKAKDMVVNLIKEMSDDIKVLIDKGSSAEAVTEVLRDAANSVLDKINTETLIPVRKGNALKVTIDAKETVKLLTKINEITSITNEINNQLANSKACIRIEAVLKINIQADKNTKVSEAKLPAALLQAAEDKKVDKISINTGVATISIAPASIQAASGIVSLSAAKVDNKSLSTGIRKVAGNNPVFDFNAAVGFKKVSSFEKPVEVTVPYTLAKGQDPEKITVFFINDKGILENKAGYYDAAAKTVSFTTDHFSRYMIKENKVSFSDVKVGTINKTYIEVMASKGIMDASVGNKFNPGSYVTRGELAQVLVNAFKLCNTPSGTLKASFKDVKATDKYFEAVALVTKTGLMSANKGMFKPFDKVSRQDAAKILATAEKVYKAAVLSSESDKFITFADKSNIRPDAKAGIAFMVQNKVMEVKPNNSFKPTENITRSELAKIMYLLLRLG